MKLITAVIQPAKLDDVRRELKAAGVQGMTVTEVQGFGRQAGVTEVYRGAEYTPSFIPKIKVELLADAADVDRLTDLIISTARSGAIGDGKVWSTDLDAVYRIRTGESGADALI